jgi:ChpA-C
VQMKTRVAGVLAASAAAVAMMGAPAFASPAHHHYGQETNVGNISILSGNTIYAPISIPINVCGNAIAILGVAEASCQGGAGVFNNSPYGGW